MKQIPRIIFFGTDDFSAPILLELLEMSRENLIEITAVVSKPDMVAGRGKKIISPKVVEISRKFNMDNSRNIRIFQPEKLREIENELDEMNFDAGVLVSFGKIISQSMLDIFAKNGRAGIINFHPSLLPELRGPSPIETAILTGLRETGLTLMQLVREMDAGAILYQEKFALSGRENAIELREKMSLRGREIFREKLIPMLENFNNFEAKENPVNGDFKNKFGAKQDDEKATFSRMITKEDSILNPDEESADDAERKIRAFISWPKARLNFAKSSARFHANFPDQNIIITDAERLSTAPGDGWPDVIVFDANSRNLASNSEQKTALKIVKIISPKSGKEMLFSDYLRGLK